MTLANILAKHARLLPSHNLPRALWWCVLKCAVLAPGRCAVRSMLTSLHSPSLPPPDWSNLSVLRLSLLACSSCLYSLNSNLVIGFLDFHRPALWSRAGKSCGIFVYQRGCWKFTFSLFSFYWWFTVIRNWVWGMKHSGVVFGHSYFIFLSCLSFSCLLSIVLMAMYSWSSGSTIRILK